LSGERERKEEKKKEMREIAIRMQAGAHDLA